MFNTCNCACATITNDSLVLSLTDAITPIVWRIDLKDSASFVMRVEKNDSGLYALQKLTTKGKVCEDIAYYTEEKKALNALKAITKSMSKGGDAGGSFFSKVLTIIKNTVFIALFLVVVALIYIFFVEPLFTSSSDLGMDDISIQQTQEPTVETNPNAVGVPMSADSFLKNKEGSYFPF